MRTTHGVNVRGGTDRNRRQVRALDASRPSRMQAFRATGCILNGALAIGAKIFTHRYDLSRSSPLASGPGIVLVEPPLGPARRSRSGAAVRFPRQRSLLRVVWPPRG